MDDFFYFCQTLLGSVSDFLMTEPIKYFVGVVLVGAVGALIRSFIHFN